MRLGANAIVISDIARFTHTLAFAGFIFVAARFAARRWGHTKIWAFANVTSTADTTVVACAYFTFARLAKLLWFRHDRWNWVRANTATTVPFCPVRAHTNAIVV